MGRKKNERSRFIRKRGRRNGVREESNVKGVEVEF